MYKQPKERIDWNSSLCNPFNMDAVCKDKNNIPPQSKLSIPEKPYIRSISSIETSPFVNVEKLRTPVTGFIFKIYAYNERVAHPIHINELSEDNLKSTVETVNYNNYLPSDTFVEGFWYAVVCIAVNDTGISVVSNMHAIDFVSDSYNGCYTKEVSELICDDGFCGSHIYVCEVSERVLVDDNNDPIVDDNNNYIYA